jgi:hypothetical protein
MTNIPLHETQSLEIQELTKEIAGYNAELLALQAEHNAIAGKADKLLASLRVAQKKIVLMTENHEENTNSIH